MIYGRQSQFLARYDLTDIARQYELMGGAVRLTSPLPWSSQYPSADGYYSVSFYSWLAQMAEQHTARIEALLRCPVMPVQDTRSVGWPVGRSNHLPLEGYLVTAPDSVELQSSDQSYDEESWDFRRNTPDVLYPWGGRVGPGERLVTGLWGILDLRSVPISVVTSAPVLVGGTLLRTVATSVLTYGDVLYHAGSGSVVVVARRTNCDVYLDSWALPESEIAQGETLACYGRLNHTIESLVLLETYMEAHKRLRGGTPHPDSLVSETADKHAYTRNAQATLVDSYVAEWETLRAAVKVLAPARRLL